MYEHMDVVGHDAPGRQFVGLPLPVQQSLLGEPGETRVTKLASTHATIEVGFEFRPLLPHILDGEQGSHSPRRVAGRESTSRNVTN